MLVCCVGFRNCFDFHWPMYIGFRFPVLTLGQARRGYWCVVGSGDTLPRLFDAVQIKEECRKLQVAKFRTSLGVTDAPREPHQRCGVKMPAQ